MLKSMLTTTDNPYDPFDNFTAWYAFDSSHGYYSSAYLARIVVYSDEMSDADINRANELAIDEIVEENILGIYTKVSKEIEISTNSQ